MGFGGFADGPKASAEYRRGYLCGLIRGDARAAGHHSPAGEVPLLPLALADHEALARSREHLGRAGISVTEAPSRLRPARPRR